MTDPAEVSDARTGPRIVFLGNDPWSATALHGLVGKDAGGLVPSLVLTRVPRPAGRGSGLRATAVAETARTLGLPLQEVETVTEGPGLEALQAATPDVVAVVAYGEILPRTVLDLPRWGCVNLHFSLLPRWRGASPVQRAIWAGDAVTGVTTIVMDEGLDTGPILEQVSVPVTPHEDAGTLGERLAGIGGVVLGRSIRGLVAGSLPSAPQSEVGVTYAPKLSADDRWIDWSESAEAVGRRVRAVSPSPGATTRFRGEVLKIVRGEAFPGLDPGLVDVTRSDPGLILEADPAIPAVSVGTGRGVYRVFEVGPAGRNRMSAVDWARGARFSPGERLG
ncbi:MAG: methionyl-tRNA formyltransferase [Actinomycetota bacterium]